ncbi:MAG: hypothetical protein M1557_06705, partial [Actinobacteria bacterium]|nr:hypothetical protein [Actinomycetota bacterium]
CLGLILAVLSPGGLAPVLAGWVDSGAQPWMLTDGIDQSGAQAPSVREEVTIFVGQDEGVCRKRAGRDDVSGRVEW